ncbi:MAG TPA: hypothetical protein VD836_12155 [Solirubrobacteraceae bacterium]|nr:hypothetical protein [Solirubrobacteraceae bacterium]
MMFGVDELIASASDGTKLLVIVGVSILLGLRHATDPDHLAAMTALIAGHRGPTPREAARLGATWGFGHATTIVACGVPIVLFDAYLPDAVQRSAETAVGLIIISLAIALLARRRRCVVHAPDRHPHVDVHASGSDHAPERPAVERTALQAYGLGLLHGIGGSAGIGLLLLASIHDHTYALLALALFAGFSAISMTAFSGLFGRTFSRSRPSRSLDRLTPIAAVASLSFGVWYSLTALQLVA